MTIRELRGITEEEFAAALSAARKLLAGGAEQAGVEVLAGLALYDPFHAGVWRELEHFCCRKREPQAARLFGEMRRALES